jgi:hypothetical protein
MQLSADVSSSQRFLWPVTMALASALNKESYALKCINRHRPAPVLDLIGDDRATQ